MSNIIQLNPKRIILPKQTIKNICDEAHRRDWEDPDRYERQKAKALRYIPVRAKEVRNWEKLVWEVRRVFHDDLDHDPDVKEAAQRACYEANVADPPLATEPTPQKATDEPERGEVRGVSDHDNVLELLSWEKKEEDTTP